MACTDAPAVGFDADGELAVGEGGGVVADGEADGAVSVAPADAAREAPPLATTVADDEPVARGSVTVLVACALVVAVPAALPGSVDPADADPDAVVLADADVSVDDGAGTLLTAIWPGDADPPGCPTPTGFDGGGV